jgi:hypothetical protein
MIRPLEHGLLVPLGSHELEQPAAVVGRRPRVTARGDDQHRKTRPRQRGEHVLVQAWDPALDVRVSRQIRPSPRRPRDPRRVVASPRGRTCTRARARRRCGRPGAGTARRPERGAASAAEIRALATIARERRRRDLRHPELLPLDLDLRADRGRLAVLLDELVAGRLPHEEEMLLSAVHRAED